MSYIIPSWRWTYPSICRNLPYSASLLECNPAGFNPPRHWTQPPKPSACSTPWAWTLGHQDEVFPTTFCTKITMKPKTKKNTKGCYTMFGSKGPRLSGLLCSLKVQWQILKSQQIADWQKRDAKISASLRTKGGVTTSTSDVAQLTLHFARDLPLWHICLTNMPQLLLLTSISVAKAKPHQGLSKLQRWKTLGTNLPTLLLRDQFAQQTHPEVCHDHKSQFKSTSS